MSDANLESNIEKANRLSIVLKNKGLSQGDWAAIVGCSTAVVSLVLNHKFESVSPEMLDKIFSILQQPRIKLFKTSNFVSQTREFNEAKENCFLRCILGGAGYGKTSTGFNYYQNTPNTYYVRCYQSETKKMVMKSIAQALALKTDGNVNELILRISNKLNSVKNSLLIIDEVSVMSTSILYYIREIRDRTENNAGIVIMGGFYFEENLNKAVKRGKYGIPEFMSRISGFLHLEAPTPKEIKIICEGNGITDKEMIKLISSQCKDFRMLTDIILKQLKKA
jgi:hypothetical protein